MSGTPHKFKSVGRFTVNHIRKCLGNFTPEDCLASLRIMSKESLAYLSQHKDDRGFTFIQTKLKFMNDGVSEVFEMIKLLETPHDCQYRQHPYGCSILSLLFSRVHFIHPKERPVFLDALDYVLSKTEGKSFLDEHNKMRSLLHVSVLAGDTEVTELLLRHGLKASKTDNLGFSPDDYAKYYDPEAADESTPVREFYTAYLAMKNNLSLELQTSQPRNRIRL